MKSWQRKHKAKMNTIRSNNALPWRVLSALSIGVCGYDVYKRLNGSEAERVSEKLMEMGGRMKPNYDGVDEIIKEYSFLAKGDRPPRKIEWVKYDDNEWYHCEGELILRVGGKEVRISQYNCLPLVKGVLPAFWSCSKWSGHSDEWEFEWDLYGEYYKDFNFLERQILEQLWKNNAPDGYCYGCIED